jgi:hypothetical protein
MNPPDQTVQTQQQQQPTSTTTKNQKQPKPQRNQPDDDDKHSPGTKLGHYVIGKSLGKGTFGKVKQAQHELTLETVRLD